MLDLIKKKKLKDINMIIYILLTNTNIFLVFVIRPTYDTESIQFK